MSLNKTTLPIVPKDFTVVEVQGREKIIPFPIALHLLLSIIVDAWQKGNYPEEPGGFVIPDSAFHCTFKMLIFAEFEKQWSNAKTTAWAAERIMRSNLRITHDDTTHWKIPANGYSVQSQPGQDIGACVLATTVGSADLSAFNSTVQPMQQLDSPPISRNLTVLTEPSVVIIDQGPQCIPKKAVATLMIRYLYEVLFIQRAESWLGLYREGRTYVSESVDGWQLKVTYVRVRIAGEPIRLIHIAESFIILLRELAINFTWREFSARASLGPESLDFLAIEISPVKLESSPNVTGNVSLTT